MTFSLFLFRLKCTVCTQKQELTVLYRKDLAIIQLSFYIYIWTESLQKMNGALLYI